ncbi:unnamed protein product [Arctogadus glacialis]
MEKRVLSGSVKRKRKKEKDNVTMLNQLDDVHPADVTALDASANYYPGPSAEEPFQSGGATAQHPLPTDNDVTSNDDSLLTSPVKETEETPGVKKEPGDEDVDYLWSREALRRSREEEWRGGAERRSREEEQRGGAERRSRKEEQRGGAERRSREEEQRGCEEGCPSADTASPLLDFMR